MSKRSNKDWTFEPRIGIGPIKYHINIKNYAKTYDIRLIEPEGSDVTGWGTYEIYGLDKTIWTKNGMVISIRCDDNFTYKGKNLIGMPKAELIAHMERAPMR